MIFHWNGLPVQFAIQISLTKEKLQKQNAL